MGNYTELVCAFELRNDTPRQVIKALEYMTGETPYPVEPLAHKLFTCPRWKHMLMGDSYYFDGDTHSTIKKDDITGDVTNYVTIRCNFKNYDDEIAQFIDWIKPYCESKGFIGYSRYEYAEHPTLIYI